MFYMLLNKFCVILFAVVYSSDVFCCFVFCYVLYLFSNFITVLGIFKFHPRSRVLCLSRSHHHLNLDI